MKTLLYLLLIFLFVGCDFDFPDLDLGLDLSFGYTPYWDPTIFIVNPEYLVELDDTTNLGVIQKANRNWGEPGDVANLANAPTASAALADFNGQSNSRSMYDDYHSSGMPANCYGYFYDFSWYVPAAGELNLVLRQLRDSLDRGVYWSSSEVDSVNAWAIVNDSGPILIKSQKDSWEHICLCVRKFRK